jgi:hypothetical protein
MPKFSKTDDLTKEQAINSILMSIAMEEAALSHILNVEGEKIQYALTNCADIQEVIEVNESVTSLLEQIIDLQIILKHKMKLAKDFLPPKSDNFSAASFFGEGKCCKEFCES